MADNFCECNSITGIKYQGRIQDSFTFIMDGLITIELLNSFQEESLVFFRGWAVFLLIYCDRSEM